MARFWRHSGVVKPGRTTPKRRASWRPLILEALEERNLLSFLPAVNYSVGGWAYYLRSADLNNDGIPDLVATNATNNSGTGVSAFLGNGDGTFRRALVTPAGQLNPYGLALGDFDGDGNIDLAVSFLNGTVSIFLGNGDGTFQAPQTYPVGTDLGSMVAGDFNNDGITDLAVADYNNGNTGSVDILLGNGDGTFQVAGSYTADRGTQTLALGDVNNDGNADLVVTNYYGSDLSLLLGNGDGTFQPAVTIQAGDTPRGVALADLTGSGNLDLITANLFSNDVSILMGNGDGTFQAPVNIPAGRGPGTVVVDDFNADGIPDLAVTNYFDTTLTVFLGNGDGTFQNAGDFTTSSQVADSISGDFNGDGFPDLAVANSVGSQIQVLINAADWSGPGSAASDRYPAVTRLGASDSPGGLLAGNQEQRVLAEPSAAPSGQVLAPDRSAVTDVARGSPPVRTATGSEPANFGASLVDFTPAAFADGLLDALGRAMPS